MTAQQPTSGATRAHGAAVMGRARRQACWGADTLSLLQPEVPAGQVPVHRHDEAHVVIVLRGRYETAAAGVLGAGVGPQMVFNPPRTEHQDRFAAGVALPQARFLTLGLGAATWLRLSALREWPCVAQQVGGEAVQRAARACASALQAPPGSGWHLQQVLQAVWEPCAEGQVAAVRASTAWVRRAQALLRDMAMAEPADLRLDEAAALLGVHPVYMARAFRRHHGLGPAQYWRSVCLDKAAAMVLHTREPLSEVAVACGYSDQAHLTRAFGLAYGQSPGRMRRERAPAPG